MLLPHAISLALLACSVAAKPVARPPLHKRRYTNSSILGITKTLTGPVTPTRESRPLCTSTYLPREDENCGEVAATYRIHLHQNEANDPSTSGKCKDILRGYGICCGESIDDDTTNGPTISLATGIVATGTGMLLGPTAPVGALPTNVTLSNTTLFTNSGTREEVIIRLVTTTLTYTLGVAGASSLRTTVVTHTITDLVTLATTVTADAASSTLSDTLSSLAVDDAIMSSSPPDATCSSVPPPPAAVTNAVVQGCTEWYTAIPGDFCYKIAVQFNVPVNIFMDWNPSINAPWCTNLQAGSAYCVATCENPGSTPTTPETQSLTVPAPTINSPVLPSIPSPTLPDIPSPTLPAGVTSLMPSPTLPAGVTSLPPSPTLPDIPSPTLPDVPSPTLPAGVTNPPPSSSTILPSSTSTTSIPVPEPPASSQPAPSASSGTDVYRSYLGDGSAAAGWPSENQWVDFDYMFEQNRPNMKASCAQWGVPDDSDQEIADMKSALTSVSASSGIDSRFILAIIMQESTGCVRVITSAYSHPNPGLMQSHNGTGTCNTNMAPLGIPGVPGDGIVQTPCPASAITQMISDGTEGTSQGDGLVQLLQQQGDAGAQGYYRAARMYNGGSIDPSGLLERGCCTASYASDVANRLTGWVNGARSFSG